MDDGWILGCLFTEPVWDWVPPHNCLVNSFVIVYVLFCLIEMCFHT